MDIKLTCPLGSVCEEIKDNKLHRCRWYTNVKGKHPQSEEILDQWDCSLAWLPWLLVENAQTNRGQTQALEMLRDETIKRQDIFNGMIAASLTKRKALTK